MSFRNIFQIVFFRLLYVYGIHWNRILNLYKLLQGLKKNLRPNLFKISNYYMLGSRKCNIIHTRLRHLCSSLGADLFRATIVNDPNCPCGCHLEDDIHYLLECSLDTNARMQIIYEYYTIYYCYLNWNPPPPPQKNCFSEGRKMVHSVAFWI